MLQFTKWVFIFLPLFYFMNEVWRTGLIVKHWLAGYNQFFKSLSNKYWSNSLFSWCPWLITVLSILETYLKPVYVLFQFYSYLYAYNSFHWNSLQHTWTGASNQHFSWGNHLFNSSSHIWSNPLCTFNW